MRVAAVLLLAGLALVGAARELAEPADIFAEDAFPEEHPETVLLVDESGDGSLRVTGMLQSFRLEGDFEEEAEALQRPRSSFLDLAWSSWVDERLEVFDLLQALLSPRPACPHMQAGAGALDTSMVSYLASSRFGPAILTTYAQTFVDDGEEDEDDFDYASVSLPDGGALPAKSYADASLLEGLSADADRAFESAESGAAAGQQRRSDLGFFGAANLQTPQEQVMWLSGLDGDAESLQPSLLRRPAPQWEAFDSMRLERSRGWDEPLQAGKAASMQPSAGLALFLLLAAGCVFVWASLVRACCRLGAELRGKRSEEAAAAHKLAQQELLVPLVPEGAIPAPASRVEIAAGHAPNGTYFAPSGAGYTTVAVPLLRA